MGKPTKKSWCISEDTVEVAWPKYPQKALRQEYRHNRVPEQELQDDRGPEQDLGSDKALEQEVGDKGAL